jgi:hypothetical protein
VAPERRRKRKRKRKGNFTQLLRVPANPNLMFKALLVLAGSLGLATASKHRHQQHNLDNTATTPLWMVWLGGTIGGFHKECWESCIRVHTHSRINVRLVTDDTISKWIPSLHPSFHLLDNVARSDYLRSELLYNHGGFYLDADVICKRSLEPVLSVLTGKVVGGGAPGPYDLNNNMLGPFLPHSPYVTQWHQRLYAQMDALTPRLQQCANQHPSSSGGVVTGIAYPTHIKWGDSICGLPWGYMINFEITAARQAYADGVLVNTFIPCNKYWVDGFWQKGRAAGFARLKAFHLNSTGYNPRGSDGQCDLLHKGCADLSVRCVDR